MHGDHISIPSLPSPGAMEERNKNEQVHCPVCRALWPYPYPLTSPSNNYGPDVMPVTVPVEREGAGPGRSGWLKRVGSHPGLSQEKNKLLDELKEVRCHMMLT